MVITKKSFFGWTISHAKIAKDEIFKVRYAEDMTRVETGNLTLYTKGLISGVKDGDSDFAIVDRVPGLYSSNLKPIPGGSYTFTTHEDSEWWCISYILNRNSLPNVEVFRLEVGESVSLPIGTKLFVCEGEHTINDSTAISPVSYEVSIGAADITAITNCYGFYLME